MSERMELRIPDLGELDAVEVVEVLVKPGDRVGKDDGLVTLESDKATMDVPSEAAGVVREVHLERGAKVAAGALVVTLEVEGAETAEAAEEAEAGSEAEAPAPEEPAAEKPKPVKPVRAEAPASAVARDVGSADASTRLLVLGAGPGGYTAAFRAADLGLDVTLVERYPTLGGVCLNVGCIPSKALLHVARVMAEAEALRDHGVDFGEARVDLEKLRGFKSSVVGRLTKGLGQLAKRRKVRVIQGTGRLTSPNTVAVEGAAGEQTIRFESAILATGSRVVRIQGVPWDDPRVLDSTGALDLEDVPKRLLVVGGGIIGLEMAMVYGALGSQLTIVELLDGLIPGCDRDLVKPLQRRLEKELGAKIHLSTRVTEIKPQKRGLKAFFEGEGAPASATFDRVLVAVGRRPNGDRLGADAAGVTVDDRGFVPVDEFQRTNLPHIYAIGDLTGNPMLAHKATHEARVAAEVAAGEKSAFDARVIPNVAYTDPEIAWVGLTETEAAEKGVAYEKGSFPWAASGRALGMARTEGSTKILFDPETSRVLGGGIVGPGAGDLIAELALAIEMDCEAADLALTIHPHPTVSETLALAAESYEGTITDLYHPRRK